MTDIFKSKFTLKFKDKEIGKAYQEKVFENMRFHNIIYCVINIVISLANNILFSTTLINLEDSLFTYIKISSYVLSGIHITILICLIFGKHVYKVFVFINYKSKLALSFTYHYLSYSADNS